LVAVKFSCTPRSDIQSCLNVESISGKEKFFLTTAPDR
jgi:hypothetical protein